MELKKAIERVAKICPKVKEQVEQYGFIRFCSAMGDQRAYVYATDGLCFARAELDEGLTIPNALLESSTLVKAAKTKFRLAIEDVGFGHIEVRAVSDTLPGTLLYKMQSENYDKFLMLPTLPEKEAFTAIPQWPLVAKVFHAAGKPKESADLAVIHFNSLFVEATDKRRLARVIFSGPWDGLISNQLFKSWPKGDVLALFQGGHAFFSVGDELRISGILSYPYPDTKTIIPKASPGSAVLVQTAVLQEVVARCTEVSDVGLVHISFDEHQIVLRTTWVKVEEATDADADVFAGKVPIVHGAGKSGSVLVKGKFLQEALKPVKTPTVKLGYGGSRDPLQIGSGWYTTCLWQMTY